jgi:hypothetical protein
VQVPQRRTYFDPTYSNGTFLTFIHDAFENSTMDPADLTSSNQAVISFGDSYIGWNYKTSGELHAIRKALFKVLKFNRRLRDLSSQVLKSCGDPRLQKGAFIGVHLRGENDWPAALGTVKEQMKLYVAEIEKIQATVSGKIKTVYVSSRNATATAAVRGTLVPLGYSVHESGAACRSSTRCSRERRSRSTRMPS